VQCIYCSERKQDRRQDQTYSGSSGRCPKATQADLTLATVARPHLQPYIWMKSRSLILKSQEHIGEPTVKRLLRDLEAGLKMELGNSPPFVCIRSTRLLQLLRNMWHTLLFHPSMLESASKMLRAAAQNQRCDDSMRLNSQVVSEALC